jgi:acyl carrier protein
MEIVGEEETLVSRRPDIRQGVIGILEGMVADWSLDGVAVTPETRLVADLEFASVDVIHLAVAIEEHFKRPRLGFQELLMKDGRYVDDVTVAQIIDFVARKLGGSAS